MIRNNINELFIRLNSYNNCRNKIGEFEKIIKDAFNYLNELRNKYYLIPKVNIDNKITFDSSNNEDANFTNFYARFKVSSVTSIKKSIVDIICFEPIKNNLKMNLIRELEKE